MMSDVRLGKGVVYCPPLIEVDQWDDNYESDGKTREYKDSFDSYKQSYE